MDNSKKPIPKRRLFIPNNTYLSIAIYTIATFAICIIIFKFINNWRDALKYTRSAISTLSPFFIAFLIVYFIGPMVDGIDKVLFSKVKERRFTKIHKYISLSLAYILFIGVIVVIMIVVIPQLADSIMQLIKQSSTLYSTVLKTINSLSEQYPDIDFEYIEDIINESMPDAISYFQSMMTSTVPKLYNVGMSVFGWLVNIIMAFVISCYLMSDQRILKNGLRKIMYALFSESTSYKIIYTIKQCNKLFSKYIFGKALDSLIIGILCFISMSVLNLSYALLISLVVGVTNMIPYFGPFIGAVPGALILLIISPKQTIIFLILILALQQLDGNIIGPKILGNSVGIKPLWIIFAITVGGALGGVVGMFLGVPVVAVISHLLNMLCEYALYKRNILPDLSNITVPEINPNNVLLPPDIKSDVMSDINPMSEEVNTASKVSSDECESEAK